MGLEIPNLDQKDFETFRAEALAKLPSYCRQWTEYNASDPGITIVELLSWMGDINSYRLNHLGEEHYLAFLALLGKDIPKKETPEKDESIGEAFLNLSETLSLPSKAVTLKDYEYLALHTEGVDLLKCKAMVDEEVENQVSVLIVLDSQGKSDAWIEEMKKKVRLHLDEKRLLTTRVKIEEKVDYVPVNVHIRVKTRYADPDLLRAKIESVLESFLHSHYGGSDGKGWEFGEDVHISHLYLLLKEIKEIEKIDFIYFSEDQAVKVTVPKMSLPRSGRHKVTVQSIKVLGVCHETDV